MGHGFDSVLSYIEWLVKIGLGSAELVICNSGDETWACVISFSAITATTNSY
jgi:hypothetical protein